jgi:hypothetical protein
MEVAYNEYRLPTGFYMTDEEFSAAKQRLIDRYTRLNQELVILEGEIRLWGARLVDLGTRIQHGERLLGPEHKQLREATLGQVLIKELEKLQVLSDDRDAAKADLDKAGIRWPPV